VGSSCRTGASSAGRVGSRVGSRVLLVMLLVVLLVVLLIVLLVVLVISSLLLVVLLVVLLVILLVVLLGCVSNHFLLLLLQLHAMVESLLQFVELGEEVPVVGRGSPVGRGSRVS
jgi:Flp pilus assembly protein TadB